MVIGGIIILSYWEICRFFDLMMAHDLCSSEICFFRFIKFIKSLHSDDSD